MRDLILELTLLAVIFYSFLDRSFSQDLLFYFKTIRKSSLFTIWTLCLVCVFLVFDILRKGVNFLFQKKIQQLDNLCRHLFTLSLTCSSVVTLGYWALFAYDLHFWMPKLFLGREIKFCLSKELIYHLIPFVVLCIIWTKNPIDVSHENIMHLILFGCSYVVVSNVNYFITGYRAYNFMSGNNLLTLLPVFVALNAGLVACFTLLRLIELRRPSSKISEKIRKKVEKVSNFIKNK